MAQNAPGYRDVSEAEKETVKMHKFTEEQWLRVLDGYKAQGHLIYDQRWLAIARTDFERGFMALNRAVFKPTRIALPEDVDEAVETIGENHGRELEAGGGGHVAGTAALSPTVAGDKGCS